MVEKKERKRTPLQSIHQQIGDCAKPQGLRWDLEGEHSVRMPCCLAPLISNSSAVQNWVGIVLHVIIDQVYMWNLTARMHLCTHKHNLPRHRHINATT